MRKDLKHLSAWLAVGVLVLVQACSDDEEGRDVGSETDTATDTGVDPSVAPGTDSGTDPSGDSGTDPGVDPGTDLGRDVNADTFCRHFCDCTGCTDQEEAHCVAAVEELFEEPNGLPEQCQDEFAAQNTAWLSCAIEEMTCTDNEASWDGSNDPYGLCRLQEDSEEVVAYQRCLDEEAPCGMGSAGFGDGESGIEFATCPGGCPPELRAGASAGSSCVTPSDCAQVCCVCAGNAGAVAASACNAGTCESAEQVCAHAGMCPDGG